MAMCNVISLNCNGLSDLKKLNCIFALCNDRRYDIVCLQETFWNETFIERVRRDKVLWNGDIFYSNGSNNRQGVAIMIGNKFKGLFNLVDKDDGRFIHVQGKIGDKTVDVYNVYAPNNVSEKYNFFLKCKDKVSIGEYVIFAGDFNTTLSPLDRASKTKHVNDKSVLALLDLMNQKQLYDIWRNRNLYSKHFSRKQIVEGFLTQSRIDYFLVSNEIKPYIKNVYYSDTSFSDHCIVNMKLDFSDVERGPGVWIFNNSFLQDQIFVDKIKNIFEEEIGSDFYKSHPLIWWDNLKFRIKKTAQIYGREKQKERNKEFYKLQNRFQEMSAKSANGLDIDTDEFFELKHRLDELEKFRCDGAILRSKSIWSLESDRNTSYFLQLEKQRQVSHVIRELKRSDGVIVKETNDILDVIHDFYKDLFSCVQSDEYAIQKMLEFIHVTIDENEVDMCDQEITVDEIYKSLSGMSKGKTPGPDGLTVEFYMYFFNELKNVFHYIYKHIEEKKELSKSMKYSMINLIYKNKGEKTDLKNYRPISLLNVDYKILARVMSNRLKLVLPKIISPTQSCCIIGKDISDTTISVKDLLDIVELDELEGLLLKLDQEKAFDRVVHDYLFAVLEKFGFGEKFCSWIKIFYNNIFSCVKCNGFLTPYFRLKNSVKQGCPISALLYVLIAEPLSVAIKQNKNIRGISIPGTDNEAKIFSHADDTTLTLSDICSVKETFNVLELYSKASGAKLNKSKSEVMALGKSIISKSDLDQLQIKECKDVVQLLGIWIGKNKLLCETLNWEEKVSKISKILSFWKNRNLTLHGKVSVITSLLMSKLWYTLMVVDIPDKYCQIIKNKCLEFLWNGKPPLVSYKIIVKKTQEGGLNFPDISQKMFAFRLKFLARLLDRNYVALWKSTCLYFMSKIENMKLGLEILFCDIPHKNMKNIPDFYKTMLKAWNMIRENVEIEVDAHNVFHVPLFFNPLVKYNDHMLFFKPFIEAGITKIKDISFECKKGFLKPNYVVDIIHEKCSDISVSRIKHFLGIIFDSLPDEWKQLVQTNENVSRNVSSWSVILKTELKLLELPLKTKMYYDLLIHKMSNESEPKSVMKWMQKYPQLEINRIYRVLNLPFLQSDIRELAYKLFNNVIFTKEKLFQCKITTDDLCPICLSEKENIYHLIFDCSSLAKFDDFMKNFLHNILAKSLPAYVNSQDYEVLCMFGLLSDCKDINFYFVNNVLSFRRFCVVKRRNIAIRENKYIDLISYFKSVLNRNVQYAYEYYKFKNSLNLFEKYYSKNNPVLSIQNASVSIDFD